MSFSRIGIAKTAALAACAVAAVSCGSSNSGTLQADSTTTPSATVTVLPPPLTRTSSAGAPPAQQQTQTETVTVPAAQPPQPAQVVPCVDPQSTNVENAVAGLGTDSLGGRFVIDEYTQGTSAGGCPELEWARATGTGVRNGTVQSHVLFFTNGGRYLGTATSDAYSYTSVISSSNSTVDVRYRWLSDGDALCCPSNESVVTFTLDGGTITPSGQFPPKQ
ncbi:LppP/LprE family lipoprotein [Actinomycetes bacterium M1A6_2h]